MALKNVLVSFENPNFNYITSVNGRLEDKVILVYFVGTCFNVAAYPNEVFRECIGAEIV